MKRILVGVATCLMLASISFAQEKPQLPDAPVAKEPPTLTQPLSTVKNQTHHWYKDGKNWAALGLSVGSSAAASIEVAGCRNRADLRLCDGHYGPYAPIQGLRMGLSITLGTLSVVGHEKGYKEWFIWAAGVTGYNTYTAIQQARVPAKKD